MTDEWVEERWVYVGKRIARNSALDHAFAKEDDLDGTLFLFKKAPTFPVIGGIYVVETQGDSAKIQSAKADGHLSDTMRINKWRLESQVATARKEHDSAAKRMASHNTDIGSLTLREIKQMIANQPSHVARGTIVVVMDYLR